MSIVNVRFHTRAALLNIVLNAVEYCTLYTLHTQFKPNILLQNSFSLLFMVCALAYYFGLFHAFFRCFSSAIIFALDVLLWPHTKSPCDWKKRQHFFFLSEKRVFSVGCKWINKCGLFEQHQIFKTLIYTLSRSRTIWIFIIIISFFCLRFFIDRCCFQFDFLSIHLTTLYVHIIPLI